MEQLEQGPDELILAMQETMNRIMRDHGWSFKDIVVSLEEGIEDPE